MVLWAFYCMIVADLSFCGFWGVLIVLICVGGGCFGWWGLVGFDIVVFCGAFDCWGLMVILGFT